MYIPFQKNSLPYNFKCKPHKRQLINKTRRLADASFIVRVFIKLFFIFLLVNMLMMRYVVMLLNRCVM